MVDGYADQMAGIDPIVISEALVMMRQASVLVRRLETYFAAHQLSQLRFLVMMVIDREVDRGSLTAVEISDRLDVSKPVLTRALRSLLDDELIVSRVDDVDGRAKQVALSRTGKRRLRLMLPDYFRELASYMKEIG